MTLQEHTQGIRRLEEIRNLIDGCVKVFRCKDFTLHTQNNCEVRLAIPMEQAHNIAEARITSLVGEYNGLAKAMRVDDGLSLNTFTAERYKEITQCQPNP